MSLETIYIDQFTDYTTYVQVGEYTIPLPEKPKDKHIINYGKPTDKQVFERTKYKVGNKEIYVSDIDYKVWNLLSDNQKKEIADKEWHKRINGCWYFIGGRTIYIPGSMYFFLNYFKFTNGTYPSFWDSQWFDFLLLEDSFYRSDVLGVEKVKGRRGGGTAVAISFELWAGTMFSGSKCGNMNKNEKKALEINYAPIAYAFVNLPHFFLLEPYRTEIEKGKQPQTKNILDFRGRGRDYINSAIDYRATKDDIYDGEIMRFLLLDEVWKWEYKNPLDAILKLILTIKDGGIKNNLKDEDGNIIRFAGLMYLIASVDEISEDQIDNVNEAWNIARPETATSSWCSTHGIRRYFEPFYFGSKGFIDKFGFSDTGTATTANEEQYQNILKEQGESKAREFRRQHPRTIDDALMPSVSKSVFNPIILAKALENIKNLPENKIPIRYKLVWEEKYRTVKAIPVPEAKRGDMHARFTISMLPEIKNNVQIRNNSLYPNNKDIFLMSIDPIDYDKASSERQDRLSDGSCRVKRMLDMSIDGNRFDDEGNPIELGFEFETNRTVLTYSFRPEYTYEFIDDMLKVAIFYGCYVMMERTSQSLKQMFIDCNMGGFLLDNKGQPITQETRHLAGIKTSMESKVDFFQAGDLYFSEYALAERHIEIIEQLKDLTPENMTKRDLGTSFLIGEWASNLRRNKFKDFRDRNRQAVKTGINFKFNG